MKKRILCIDGGGIKGLFPASFLERIEKEMELPLCNYFDMIAGTSTGAIIAAALALGIPAAEICNMYRIYAKDIFPQYNFLKNVLNIFKKINGSQYSNKPLGDALINVFGEKRLGDCKTRLLIPSFNLTLGTAQVFKTSHAPDLRIDYQKKIVDVLLATSAAPTYLPPYITNTGTYIDGGIGANNPSILAVTEGISRCEWKKEEIFLLSLGCTHDFCGSTNGHERMGFINIDKLINTFMEAESQYSKNMTHIILGKDNYLRINPMVAERRVALDNSSSNALKYLSSLGAHEAQLHLDQIIKCYLNEEKEPFVPCHTL